MKPTLMNIRERAKNPEFYDRTRDMETALAWSSIRRVLREAGREELFAYIQSVRLTDKNIVISTGKPIVNEEIRQFRTLIITELNITLTRIHGRGNKEKLQLI